MGWAFSPPSRCAVCGAWPAQALCDGCVERFGQAVHRCSLCALPVADAVAVCGACVKEPPPLDACFAAVDYAYPWSTLVSRFKFHGEPGWAAALARRMARVPGVDEELRRADLVLPIPLATRRLAERGFNQALLLAHRLGRGWGVPVRGVRRMAGAPAVRCLRGAVRAAPASLWPVRAATA